jgi:hypothetical protein
VLGLAPPPTDSRAGNTLFRVLYMLGCAQCSNLSVYSSYVAALYILLQILLINHTTAAPQIQYVALDAATPVHILDYSTGIDFPVQPAVYPLPLHALLQIVRTVCVLYERLSHYRLERSGDSAGHFISQSAGHTNRANLTPALYGKG